MSNYFTPSMIDLVTPTGLRVTQQAAAPLNDLVTEATYNYFPLNIVAVGDCATSRNSTWSGTIQHRIWANRWYGGHNPKDNVCQPSIVNSSGKVCRMRFTSINKAGAATAARLAYSAGYSEFEADGVSGYGDILGAVNLTYVSWNTANSTKDTFFSRDGGDWAYSTNVVILPYTRLCDTTTGGKEFGVDYEPQDGRTGTQTTTLLTKMAQLAHAKGYTFTLYTNPLDGTGGTPWNGLLPVLDTVLDTVDYFNLLVYSGNSPIGDSLDYQMSLFTDPDTTKFQVTYGLGGLEITDAQDIRDRVVSNNFAGIEFFRNGVEIGGDCTSNPDVVRQMATLLGLTSC